MIWVWIASMIVLFPVGQLIHLSLVMTWEDQRTTGLGYYGRSPADRMAFKRTLRRHARILSPILIVLGKTTRFTFEKASFSVNDLTGPRGSCDEESFERGLSYAARPEDVFVVTQMKCGTTWMQHVVYQVLEGGDGDLVGTGTALYAVSPWLEARKSVSIEDAPLVGSDRPARIIKTHLPVDHCPFDAAARYIYVARHPVSCFASTVDFIRANAGPLQPQLADIEHWFTSRHMWWMPWTTHVVGWWDRARQDDNVMFVRFEDMKTDLPGVIRQVAAFLDVEPLSDDAMARVSLKCSFDYMREHEEAFEMHPPHLFSVDTQMFVRGTTDRYRDVDPDTAEGIRSWCRSELARSSVPLEELYPE